VKQEPKNMITLLITPLCIGFFFFLFFKDSEKGWLGFLIMITKCGNPLIWDAHLLKEVMKSDHFLVESIESQTNHFWSPPSSFRSFGVHMASPTAKRIFREHWGWG
jgi:hypothetical protein